MQVQQVLIRQLVQSMLELQLQLELLLLLEQLPLEQLPLEQQLLLLALQYLLA
jgi:hypothetical protein